MDSRILSALGENNSVKKLTMIGRHSSDFANEEQIRSLAQALPGNMGIEHLSLRGFDSNNETWSLLVSSLTTYPRIKRLSLRGKWTVDHNQILYASRYSADTRSTMMNKILQMLQHNTVVHTIELPDIFRNEAVYQNSILPRLEMNRFEVQRQAVKRADPSIRSQLLGRALHMVRYSPNLVFHFLLENVPAFVRTEEEEDSTIPLENDPAILSRQKKRKAPKQ